MRVERIDRIGLEFGTLWKSQYRVEEDDPLSAVAELRNTQTLSRNEWQIRVETQMWLSCTRDTFRLQASLSAFQGTDEGVSSQLGSLCSSGFVMNDLMSEDRVVNGIKHELVLAACLVLATPFLIYGCTS